MKRLIAFLLILLLLPLTGCRDTRRYYGEKYTEYFSIAVNRLLGITGSEMDVIEILEQDSKGKTMFAFISPYPDIDDKTGLYSIMICQKTDSEYSYYYPDYNFVVAHTKGEITEDEIASLKTRNDWDQDIDESKKIKVRIARSKKPDNSRGSRTEKIFKDKNEVDFQDEVISFIGLGTDKDNRWLYCVRILDRENDYKYKRTYMLILNKDYSYEDSYLQPIDDGWNYQDQLKKFKELNNWSLYVE